MRKKCGRANDKGKCGHYSNHVDKIHFFIHYFNIPFNQRFNQNVLGFRMSCAGLDVTDEKATW